MISSELMSPEDTIRDTLGRIVRSVQDSRELAVGEAALDNIARAIGMPWACWVPDTSHPYFCRQMDEFARSRGWPDELLKLWWSRHTALKMPVYIRCRFEHLPFIMAIDHGSHRRPVRLSPEHVRVNELVSALGIKTMLTVPLHLPKGQVAMLLWAGNRNVDALKKLLGTIAGDLLAVGHHFMRIYNIQVDQMKASTEERARLTPREWDCLRTLAQGYREAEVAECAGISKSTVRFHLDNVVQKFGCKNRAQAVAMAAQLGLLGPIGP